MGRRQTKTRATPGWNMSSASPADWHYKSGKWRSRRSSRNWMYLLSDRLVVRWAAEYSDSREVWPVEYADQTSLTAFLEALLFRSNGQV
jgi:hypothetical protein